MFAELLHHVYTILHEVQKQYHLCASCTIQWVAAEAEVIDLSAGHRDVSGSHLEKAHGVAYMAR